MEQEQPQRISSDLDKPLPLWFLIILPFYAGGFMALMLLPAAGDWRWLEAWLVIISFAVLTSIYYSIINYRNPRVLRNRMKFRRKGLTETTQQTAGLDRVFMYLMGLAFFGFIIVAALDHRFQWSKVSFGLEILGLVIVNIAYALMNTAILQNAFASKLLDINQDQHLIDTGLYSRIRHPLYAGGVVWLLAMPLALGSWWALIPAAITASSIVLRIRIEEEMLVEGMEGYLEYRQRVKYKLIPGIY